MAGRPARPRRAPPGQSAAGQFHCWLRAWGLSSYLKRGIAVPGMRAGQTAARSQVDRVTRGCIMLARFLASAAAPVLACCLAATGLAATEPPLIEVVDGTTPDDGRLQTPSGVCVLEPGPRIPLSYVRQPPGYLTSFAWRLPLSACSACPAPQTLIVNSVAFSVRWFSVCSAEAEVSIVGATGPTDCRVPEPTNMLCEPAPFPINGNGDESVEYTVPLPGACCVSGEAYAWVRLIGTGDCPPGPAPGGEFLPGIGAAEPFCSTCRQYVSWLPESPSLTEWCSSSGHRMLWMRVDADCCGATDAGHRSWGTLKTLYR